MLKFAQILELSPFLSHSVLIIWLNHSLLHYELIALFDSQTDYISTEKVLHASSLFFEISLI